MLEQERNEVDVSQLFKWGKRVEIYDVSNQVLFSCHLRLVGDADMNRARIYALRNSAEMRKKLKNKDSDEHVAYIADRELVTKEDLVKYCLVLQNKSFVEDAYREIKLPYPKEPDSEATLEAQEKYQLEVDSFKDKINKEVRKFIDKKSKQEEERLSKLSESQLYDYYIELATNSLCETEFIDKFRDSCIYFGSYKDEDYKVKLFSSVDEFLSLPREIKNQFVEEYNSIELSIETLKKLPVATQ